ncbi:MAG: argininosuccinate synthase [Sulfurospirillaceae bacterium]|nr:argininosuccinate synthase [Sulfurospirillaceae bacterium]
MKALVLFSGGLDSMLAIKLLREQQIEVVAIHINIGFNSKKENITKLSQRAELAGASLEIIDVRNTYLQEVLFNPRYGYGKHFNPCIDCHGFMFKVAKALLPHYGASFIATGEVIGQRPMSQKKDALQLVKRLADDLEDDLIVRPLCAKIMPESKPEREGWIDREKLLDLNGRGRSRQLELAKNYGWEDYPSPAGGCLLTDASFAIRIKDFVAYDTFDLAYIELLKNGRHFRLHDHAKLVIGRDESENTLLESLQDETFSLLQVEDTINAPSALLSSNASEQDIHEACKIILSFTKTVPEKHYTLFFRDRIFKALAYPSRDEAKKYLL